MKAGWIEIEEVLADQNSGWTFLEKQMNVLLTSKNAYFHVVNILLPWAAWKDNQSRSDATTVRALLK